MRLKDLWIEYLQLESRARKDGKEKPCWELMVETMKQREVSALGFDAPMVGKLLVEGTDD